jgi:hypothetical protein
VALSAGSVTVNASGVASGTGLAKAIYDAEIVTAPLVAVPRPGDTDMPYSAVRPVAQADVDSVKAGNQRLRQDVARRANALASALVAYLQANAEVVIPADANGDGLQSGTVRPETEKTLAIR